MEPCPICGEPLEWDEVDIGVGIQRGPTYCSNSGCLFNVRQEKERFEDATDFRDTIEKKRRV